jgi:hypothetical protein
MPNTNPSTEIERLKAENERLRTELAEAQANAKALPNTRPTPTEPSFGLSEGQRAELEANGKTTSPFTGARQVGTGEPGEKPRVVSAEEFDKVRPSAGTTAK